MGLEGMVVVLISLLPGIGGGEGCLQLETRRPQL